MLGRVELVTPPVVTVSWACRRCGHTGGVARTTFPLDPHWSEEMGRTLFQTLRLKLVRVHQRGQSCVAAPDDFIIGRYVPPGKTLMGIV